jgi:hypothetical protein
VAPEGRPKELARIIPTKAKVIEKRVLKIKVCLTLVANLRAKNPGTNKRVSMRIVPASLMLVTISRASKIKKR